MVEWEDLNEAIDYSSFFSGGRTMDSFVSQSGEDRSSAAAAEAASVVSSPSVNVVSINYYHSSHTIHDSAAESTTNDKATIKEVPLLQTTGYAGDPVIIPTAAKEQTLPSMSLGTSVPTTTTSMTPTLSIPSYPLQIYYNYDSVQVPNTSVALPFAIRNSHPIVTPVTSSSSTCSSQIYTYLVANLHRPDLHSTWGLTISLFSRIYLLISGFNNIQNHNSKGSLFPAFMADLTISPSSFWKKTATTTMEQTSLNHSSDIIKQILNEPRQSAQLAVGDCIVEIAGRKISEFQNLEEITRFLKFYPGTCLQLLLYRVHPKQSQQHSSTLSYADDEIATVQNAHQRLHQQYQQQRQLSGTLPPRALFSSHHMHQQKQLQQQQPLSYQGYSKQPNAIPPPQNKLFRNVVTKKLGIPYDDDYDWHRRIYGVDPDASSFETVFLPPIADYASWLQQRKAMWRQSYRIYEIKESWIEEEPELPKSTRCKPDGKSTGYNDRESCNVALDFWTRQGFENFHSWLHARKTAWKHDKYSWHRRKRQRLEQDREEIVHLGPDPFQTWLRVRKNQWRIARRKRQRERLRQQQMQFQSYFPCSRSTACKSDNNDRLVMDDDDDGNSTNNTAKYAQPLQDILVIDEILEEQEREREEREKKQPLDLHALLDINQGCPDDVVSQVFGFLDPLEHGKMLAIDRNTRKALMQRERLWQLLCPSRWKLPRRPRKPWHELYRVHLRIETEQKRKLWDDLLSRASNVLEKGDQLQSIEKMVTESEREYGFDINYTSGVVCERNSILNLAVIHQRHSKSPLWVEFGSLAIRNSSLLFSSRGCAISG
jgi:hypothetical protein